MSWQFACLTYHGIGTGQNQYTVSLRTLRAQLDFLKTEGYTVEGFEGLYRRLGSQFPARYVVLTFDDGDSSAMEAADCLSESGFTATFFITRDRCLNRAGYIRPPQVRELRERGFSLGTHGTSHRKLTRISEQECRDELTGSRVWLEDVLGEPVYFTAVPGGFINARVMRLAAEQRYLMIGTCSERMNAVVDTPRTLQIVNRVNVRRSFSAASFQSIVEGHSGFYMRRRLRSAALWLPKQLLPA